MFIVWRGFLYNQIEAIFSQYDMEIDEVVKGRGTYICNGSKGKFVLTSFRGAEEKGQFLYNYMANLNSMGFTVSRIERNKQNEVVTTDEATGERFLLKEYVAGAEVNVNQLSELKAGVTLLAEYHKAAIDLYQGMEKTLSDCHKEVLAEKEKHYKELVKVRNYIRNRKKKQDFERIYLNAYEAMLETAKESLDILQKESGQQPSCCICHGEFNQHNVLYTDGRWQMVNFEGFSFGWSILDLAFFLRKILEKNEWDISIGKQLLETYAKERPLSGVEYEKLYGLLLFPEKFWKVTNHYMNSRKTWISERDIEKLKKVIAQENQRLKFLENVFAIQTE